MLNNTPSNHDRDAAWGNDRLAVHTLAIEILRQHQGPSILTMAEAVTQARSELAVSEFEAADEARWSHS